VLGNGKALRYGIGVGREGSPGQGRKVSRMEAWPDWRPPEEMIDRAAWAYSSSMLAGRGTRASVPGERVSPGEIALTVML
jgi:lipoprotein-anchoring transpeptidase ErfK/SrfK